MVLATFNQSLFLEVNRYAQRTPQLHSPLLFVANAGIVIFISLLIGAYLLVRFVDRWASLRNAAIIALTGMGTILAVGVNQPVAHLFKEPRPYEALPGILVLTHRVHDYSFPSDHGVMVGAVTAGLYLVNPIFGIVSFVLGLLLAFARVYTAAHYPFDLVAGMFLGAAVVLLMDVVLKTEMVVILRKLAATPLRVFLPRSGVEATGR